ncbi:capsid protein [Cricetid gammaherpesvirus 2]|uniref:Capsid scaffolding protein n=1 Tax=Cricetid gammaherpesvirus 2 TaxID=1605972 RepID=E9M5K0_9GAMA|nr:capsid protein [Cricetid gammaherpesvirus 2]ADW24358.1 capsid protein [Cricetid gammaherpesvirus 2]ADW24440.1 capsid protein [Cricetid gammaherpesvirus 2]
MAADGDGDQVPTEVFVAGFIDVKQYPAPDKDLIINYDSLTAALPLNQPIPLNVEHLEHAEVGAVVGIFKVVHGLFCVGKIYCKPFLDLVHRMFTSSSAAKKPSTLPRLPAVEMLHAWLPELSLSSTHPELLSATPPSQILQHIALCAMGKRRGVVAVYGLDPKWVISKFNSLSTDEREQVASGSMTGLDLIKNDPPCLDFTINTDTLLSKAIDAGFIQNRLDILQTDKAVVAVSPSTYLKASAGPDPGAVDKTEDTLLEATMNPHQPQSTEDSGLISVPKSALVSLLTKHDHAQAPNAPKMPAPAFQGTGFQVPAPAHAPYYPYQHQQFAYPGQMQPPAMGIYSPWQMPCIPWPMPPQDPERMPKRKRSFDEDAFPGENSKKGLYGELLTMANSLAALKQEVDALRGAASGMQHMLKQPWHTIASPFPSPAPMAHPPIPVQQPLYAGHSHPSLVAHSQLSSTSPQTAQPPAAAAQPVQVTGPAPADPMTHAGAAAPRSAPETSQPNPAPPAGGVPATGKIDASNAPNCPNLLQKMFCDELTK